MGILIFERASHLDAFSGYPFRRWLLSDASGETTGTLELRPSRSSRTRDSPSQIPSPTEDRDRTVSRRSEPSSRTALMGEQPNPWDLLQPQDAMSRHRGAKPFRRYGLLGKISLLSPEYLLSVERRPFHSDRRITMPYFRTCSTCRSRSQAPLCHCTRRLIANQPEGTFGRLRYILGGDRPSQTTHLTLSPIRITDRG